MLTNDHKLAMYKIKVGVVDEKVARCLGDHAVLVPGAQLPEWHKYTWGIGTAMPTKEVIVAHTEKPSRS